MSQKYVPFQPNQPIYSSMFAGRSEEINRLEEVMFQTKQGNPTHILFVGERGIGKTSLLLVAKFLAQGKLAWADTHHDFLTIQVSLDGQIRMIDLAVKLKTVIEREIGKDNAATRILSKTWEFVQRLEAAGVSLKEKEQAGNEASLLDGLIFSICDTVKRITNPNAFSELGLTSTKDGIVILIDESDSACPELNLGLFLKRLTETLISEGCNKILIVLTGLPRAREVLSLSHKSSLRLFEEHEIVPLSKEQVSQVVRSGIEEMNAKNPAVPTTIDEDALDFVYTYSEGYPHFVQQIAYSATLHDRDNHITTEDVKNGMFLKGGALDQIGNRYYRDLFYNKINAESYRQILRIMAEKWNGWISISDIRKKFKGKESTLTNGLKALRDRNIILSKAGAKGQYRLQWASFAFWISMNIGMESSPP